MKLSNEQMESLAPYERHFKTAIEAGWSRHPGSSALDLMNDIYTQVTGIRQRLNRGCSSCIMNLIKDVGAIYFADLKERAYKEETAELAEAERLAVKVEDTDAEPVKAEVKVKRKYTRKNGNKKN